ARPALELDQLRCTGVVERPEPIAVPEQDGVLERSSRIGFQRLEDRLSVQDPLPRVVIEVRRASRLAELDRRRRDLVLALHPPVDGVRGDARRLAWQVEGAHGGHGACLWLGVRADPGVEVAQCPGRILTSYLTQP